MICNLKRYRELLKRSEELENLRKSLYEENEEEDLELCKYRGAIQEYLFWKNRVLFVLIVEKFLDRKISGEEFIDRFVELRERGMDECEGLLERLASHENMEDYYIDPRSFGFCTFLNCVQAEEENFMEDYENEEFYDSIKTYFLRLKQQKVFYDF